MHVELALEGPFVDGASRLRFEPVHAVKLEELLVRDARGPIAAEPAPGGFQLARPAQGSLVARYTVSFGEPGAAPARHDGLWPLAEPIELRVSGADVVLAPEVGDAHAADRIAIEVQLRTGEVPTDGASSFALGKDQSLLGRVEELRHAYFLAGDLGTATFHAADGNDIAAWVGTIAFDPRWVSAEAAGVRASVDAYVGRAPSTSAPPLSLLFVGIPKGEPAIVVRTGARGLVLAVDRRAPWTPTALLLVTQALTKRYVGGLLWVGDRAHPESGAFFSEGFARAVAAEVLSDSALFSIAERANELNSLLATTTFSSDPNALATARGALAAVALDAALTAPAPTAPTAPMATTSRSSLRRFLRELLVEAGAAKADTLPFPAFLDAVARHTSAAFAKRLALGLDGAEIELAADLLAPSYRLARRPLAPFELGFTTTAGEVLTVDRIVPGSRAHAAGLAVGDLVREVHYTEGNSRAPATVVIDRGGRRSSLRFLPAGAPKPGRIYERVPGISDPRCRTE